MPGQAIALTSAECRGRYSAKPPVSSAARYPRASAMLTAARSSVVPATVVPGDQTAILRIVNSGGWPLLICAGGQAPTDSRATRQRVQLPAASFDRHRHKA